MSDAFLYFGDTIKALDDNGKVGGYAVRFTDATRRDLSGEYFTKDTYLGAHQGDGVDVLFHHGLPLHTSRRMTPSQKQAFASFSDHIFSPAKTRKDEIGLFTEVVLDMANEYEQAVFGLVKAGKLGWSSASAGHTVKRTDDGEITRWPIIEISMTPTPAEPTNRAVTLKAAESLKFIPLGDEADPEPQQAAIEDAEQRVTAFDTLDIDTHSRLTVIAMRGITSRFHGNHEARLKAGRVLSEKNRQRIKELMGQLMSVHDDLMGLMESSMPMADDTEKRASLTADFMAKYHYRKRGQNENNRATAQGGDDAGDRRHYQEQH